MEGSPYSNQGYQSQYQYKSNQFNSAMSNNNDYYDESVSKYDSEYNQQSQQTFQLNQEQKNLPTLEKIQSNQWQLRKVGYQEMQQVFQGKQLQNNEMNGQSFNDLSLENYAPWLKNIINEKNLFALTEGLRAVEIFIGNCKGSLSNQVLKYYIGDLIEKAPLLKPAQQQMASSIICNSLLKGDSQYVVSEIIKRLDSTQPKIVLFGLQTIKLNLEYQLATQEIILMDETMRQLFKSNLSVLKNTNKDIRSTAIENLKLIYIQSQESYEEISKAFLSGQRSVHQKEIQDIFKKAKKAVSKNLQVKLIQEEMQKNLDNEKINKQVISKGQKVDLQAIIPEKFLEIPSFQQPSQKKNKLEEMWQNIEKLIVNQVQVYSYKDNKDYSNIYKILIGCLEESNFLIFSEALKCVQNLMKVMKNGIPFPILKHFLLLILDKFRGPKARQYNSIVWQALDDCYFNQCCTNEQLIDIVLTQCDNEKNLHMRIGCINWLGGRFIPHSLELVKDSLDLLNMDAQIQTQRGEKLQKLIEAVDKKIEQILKKALNLQLKESCQYLLARKANEYFNEYDKENTNSQNYQDSYQSNNINPQNAKQMNKPQGNSQQPQQAGEPSQQQGKSNQPPQKQVVENVNLLDRDYEDEAYVQQKQKAQQQQQQNVSNLLEDFDDFKDNVQNSHQDIYSNDSRLRTEGNNSRVLLNKDQETLAQSIQNELHNLNQYILKQCKIQQMEIFCQDFLNWLQNIQSDDMQAIQDLCVSYLYAFSCAVSSNKNDIKSSHYDKASELVCNSFIIMNKSCVSVNQENIQREIEVVCGILYYGHNQRISQLFDSAYFVCSLEKLLQTTYNIVKKYQINKSLSIFISWISQKLDKTTKDIDMKLLQSLLQTLEFYDEQTDGKYRILVDSINFKIDFQSQRSYGQQPNFARQNAHKNNKEEQTIPNQNYKNQQNQKQFQTYQSEQNEYYDSQQEEEYLEQSHHLSNPKSNNQANYNNNQNTNRSQTQPNNSTVQNSAQPISKQIEADLNRDFETGIENLVTYLSEINEIQNQSMHQESNRNQNKKDASPTKKQNSVSPGRPWRRGIGRDSNNLTPSRAAEQQIREIRHLAEKVCQMTNSEDLIMCQQSFYAILQIKQTLLMLSQHPNQQMEYLFFNVFNFVCRQSFKTIEQKQLLREFITQLEQNIHKQVIFTAYKNAFSIILKNYNSFAQNYLINVFMHLVYKITDDQNLVQIQIDLRDIQFFVESIIYCLSEQGLYQMGHEIMQKLFTEYDNNTLKRVFETELVNSMKYYQVYEEWQKDFINVDSSAIQHAEDQNNITDISNNNMHLDLYAELKNNNNNNNNNRDHSQDKSLASILLRNEEITNHLPKQNQMYNQNRQGINKSPNQNTRQSVENIQGMKNNEQKQNFQQHYQRNILEDDFMNEQQHFEQVQYQQNQNINRNKSNSNNSGATPNSQANRVSQNSLDVNVYNNNQNSIGMLSEESILNYYPNSQNQRGANNNILANNYNSNGANNNIFNRPPQPQQGSNNNISSMNNLNNQHLLHSNNILQEGSVFSNNQMNLDYSNSILESVNLNPQAQNVNPQNFNSNNSNSNGNLRNYQQKQQNYNSNNSNNRSFPNLVSQNNNNSSNSNISKITNNTDQQLNNQQFQQQNNKQQNDQNNYNSNNTSSNNRSLINNYLTQEQHDAIILKQLNDIQQQNSQIVGYNSNIPMNVNQKAQNDAKNSPMNKKNKQQRNPSVEGMNQSSLYDYLRENQDQNSSNLYDGQERVISQPNSNVKMYKTNRNNNNVSNSISVSQFATNQNHSKNQNFNQANYDSLEDQGIPSTIRDTHQNILDYDETGTNEPGSAERYSGMNSRLPKSGQKQKLTNRQDLHSVSPIIKQIDQLSSNRHYYVSQDGKLNFSDMSYLLPTGMKQPSNFHTIQQYNSNQQDDVWHLRYQEERDLHQRTKENLQKIQQDIQEKQKQESELLQKLEEEKREKESLSAQISQLQNLSLQQNNSRTTAYDSQQTESSKVNGVSLQEQYISYNSKNTITNHAKSPFELVPQRTKEKTDCIKQLQEILLTSEQLYNDLGEQIILHYEGLEEVIDKIDFVIDLKLAIVDKVLLENMSENNFRIILMITLRLCTSQTTQKEIYADKDQRTYRQNDLTKELQTLLDNLLSAKSVSTVLISGLKVLNSCVPQDLQTVYTKNEKMLYRLILKCLEKLLACYDDKKELRVFEVLTEIYKFFKCHPPENLNESLPCLKDLEFIFRSLKTLSDQMVSANHEMASEFVEFIISKHRKSVYLDYLQSLVNKINESIKESQIYKNQTKNI